MTGTWGLPLVLETSSCKNDNHVFTNRVVDEWNGLSGHIVRAASIGSFKRRLHRTVTPGRAATVRICFLKDPTAFRWCTYGKWICLKVKEWAVLILHLGYHGVCQALCTLVTSSYSFTIGTVQTLSWKSTV
ncbi:hypothetical protein E2C01_019926 [Portunus trituberculatus]|uniref:Uncharacterized protein n=1 Tax=Portunus trituberculatus TaxID=210409 RepID=A0A5B7DZ85_PORTR|nr:hypothetical protein [Portunus trituberculatus]